jgi:hypothetical protein
MQIMLEDTELTYMVTRLDKIIYEPEASIWFSRTLGIASRKCFQHFIGAGHLFAKYFNPSFVPQLLIRRIILVAIC